MFMALPQEDAMIETRWAWTRINILQDGSIVALPTQYVSMAEARRDRSALRDGRHGWRVISELKWRSRRLIAYNPNTSRTLGNNVVLTFVIYEKRRVEDA
jgi:hypothetical protein